MVAFNSERNYSYLDYYIGHENDFLIDANSREYQMGLYILYF